MDIVRGSEALIQFPPHPNFILATSSGVQIMDLYRWEAQTARSVDSRQYSLKDEEKWVVLGELVVGKRRQSRR